MFFRFYFNSCTEFLVSIVASKEETEKSAAFNALGMILSELPNPKLAETLIPKILAAINANLNNRKQFCFDSITCLSQLSTAVSQNSSSIPLQVWDDLLPTIFLAGLNEQVTKAASILGRNITGRTREIQIMLLQLLTYIITKKPYTIHRIPITDSRK